MTASTVSVVNNIAYPAQSSRTRSGEAAGYMAARATRDGTLFTAPWYQALVLEGRGYHFDVGSFSTPITGGGAGTVLDLDQPEAVLSIPSGTSIIPLRIAVQCQPPLSVTDNDEIEILIAVDRTAAAVNDGTKTAETIFNLRTDNPSSSLCTATSAYTADVTDPTLGIELARKVKVADIQGTAATVVVSDLELVYPQPGQVAPVIVGPASLWIYWGGTVATSGFAQIEWAEFDTSDDITA